MDFTQGGPPNTYRGLQARRPSLDETEPSPLIVLKPGLFLKMTGLDKEEAKIPPAIYPLRVFLSTYVAIQDQVLLRKLWSKHSLAAYLLDFRTLISCDQPRSTTQSLLSLISASKWIL